MARKSGRAALTLAPQQRKTLEELAASRTAPAREVERAKVLLGYAAGTSITELQRQLGFSRPMIYRCVDKALAAGVQMGLKDKYHRPHEPEITDAAKAWVVSVACTKPKDHGLAAELWTISALASFVSEGARAAGFDRLANAGKSTVWRILNENDIKPHKIRYYLEKRDPEFDRKMQEVLMVYRDVSIYSEGAVHDARPNAIYTVSVDEKPGVQAIGLTAPDLPPVQMCIRDSGKVQRQSLTRAVATQLGIGGPRAPATATTPSGTGAVLGQLSVTAMIGFRVPQQAELTVLDAWLSGVLNLDIANPAEVDSAAVAQREPATLARSWLHRSLLLTRWLLLGGRVPVFDTPRIVACDTQPGLDGVWKARVAFARIDELPGAAYDLALKGALRLCAWVLVHRIDTKNLQDFYALAEARVISKLLKMFDAGKSTLPLLACLLYTSRCV